MIVVVTPNPAVDVTYRVAEQGTGRTHRVLDVARRPGGKGVNVARVLHSAGARSRCVLPLGGAAGAWLAAALDVPATTVALDGETRTTVTVVDDVAHPTVLAEPGPRVTAAERDALTAAVVAAATGADALVVSGSLPPGLGPGDVGRLVAARADHADRTALTVADLSGPALLAAADAGVDVCKPNREELLEATGAATEEAGAADLLARGAGTVVVSRGAGGLAAHTRDGVLTVPAVPGVRGNPTGAGDAATAGLVLALTRGLDLDAALRCAAAFGAAAVLRPTAGEVDRDALAGFLTDLPLHLDLPLDPHPVPHLDPTRSPA